MTAVSIACPPRPKSVNLSFLGVESYEAVQQVYKKAKGVVLFVVILFFSANLKNLNKSRLLWVYFITLLMSYSFGRIFLRMLITIT